MAREEDEREIETFSDYGHAIKQDHRQLQIQRHRMKTTPEEMTETMPTMAESMASLNSAQLHADLHAISKLNKSESEIRAAYRDIALRYSSAVGVAHIIKNANGKWDLDPDHSTGRVPRRNDFVERFGDNCETAFQRNSIQMESFLGLQSVFVPVHVYGCRPEVLMILADDKKFTRVVFLVEILVEYFALWLKDFHSDRSNWKLTSLAAMIELISEIEKRTSVKAACTVVANELQRYLGCDQVAVAQLRGRRLTVQSISGNEELDTSSETCHLIETALCESLLRQELGTWPQHDNQSNQLLVAAKQLAREFQHQAVLTAPLTTPDGETIGAILLSGSQNLINGNRLPNFMRAAIPRISSAMEVVSRAQKGRVRRLIDSANQGLKTLKGRIWFGLAAILFGILMVPMPYRVRCNCLTETTQRRYAVAPFDGTVEKGFANRGDRVERGQLLAKMDGQAIRFELASVVAELQKSQKQREIELANRNIPASILADLESKRLSARKDLLTHQLNQLEIRSPIDGVVLSGSLERSEAASIQLGQTLYEVGPLDNLRIEVMIPAEEITHVEVGQNVRVWIDGLESDSFKATIAKIHPRSELREARNVFVAEVIVENAGERLRPGMKGRVRIDCRRRTLAWNLFHRPVEYVMSRVCWW